MPLAQAGEAEFDFFFLFVIDFQKWNYWVKGFSRLSIHTTGCPPKHETAKEKLPVLSGKAGHRPKRTMEMRARDFQSRGTRLSAVSVGCIQPPEKRVQLEQDMRVRGHGVLNPKYLGRIF